MSNKIHIFPMDFLGYFVIYIYIYMNYFLGCYYCKNLSINIEIVLSNNGYLRTIPFKIFFKRYFWEKAHIISKKFCTLSYI